MKSVNKTNPRTPVIERLALNVLSQLKLLSSKKRKLYTSTQNTLRNIYNILAESMNVISDMIDVETTNSEKTVDNADIGKITSSIKKIEEYITNTASSLEYTVKGKKSIGIDSISISTNSNTDFNAQPKEFKSGFYKDFKAAFNISGRYNKPISNPKRTGYAQLDDFIVTYAEWYKLRMDVYYNRDRECSAVYHTFGDIADSVYNFTIMYGYYLEKYNYDSKPFKDNMHKWIDDITYDKNRLSSEMYPDDMVYFISTRNSEYFTETALILWDLLLASGFKTICEKYNLYEGGPKRNGVDELFQQFAPDIYDNYIGIDDVDYLEEHSFERIGV